MGFHSTDDSGYALRENPTKTWRKQSIDTGENRVLVRCRLKRKIEEHNCKHCGKGCDSITSVFDHRRKRSRVSNKSENTQLGFEILWPVKKKRSNRGKVSRFCSVPNVNSVLEYPEYNEEEEEAALALVMLSSGFSKWAYFVCTFDFTENDSLILKNKALMRNKIKMGMKFNSSVSELGKQREPIGVELRNKNGLESVQYDSVIRFGKTNFRDEDTELGVRLNSSYSEFGDFNLGNEFKKPVDDVQFRGEIKVHWKIK